MLLEYSAIRCFLLFLFTHFPVSHLQWHYRTLTDWNFNWARKLVKGFFLAIQAKNWKKPTEMADYTVPEQNIKNDILWYYCDICDIN